MKKRVEVVVSGRVQGVWFRASARQEALRLGLTGWVRNLPDGSVEALGEGEEESLRSFVAWCRHGPPGALVERVNATWSEARGDEPSFSVRR